ALGVLAGLVVLHSCCPLLFLARRSLPQFEPAHSSESGNGDGRVRRRIQVRDSRSITLYEPRLGSGGLPARWCDNDPQAPLYSSALPRSCHHTAIRFVS